MELITWMLLTLLVPIVSLFFIQLVIQRIRFLRKMGLIPNPKSYPIIGNIIDFMVPHKYLQDVIKLHIKNYPKLFNLWLGPVATVTLVKPQHLEVILGNAKYIDKTFHYSFLGPWLGTGLLTSTGTKWHSHRKLITPTFHFKILENFVEVFAEKSEILVKKLKMEEGKESFNVYPHITKCALDIICETAMGTEINAQTQEVNSDYVKAVYEISEVVMNRMLSPWLYLDFIFKMTPSGRRLKNCVKILHSFTNKVIRERKQYYRLQNSPESSDEDRMIGRRKRMAFLDLLLDASEKGNNLTDEEIREEVDTFMFEGHDTTTAAICWALHLLGAHPHIQSKVYEELDNIFQGSDRPTTMKDLNEMKYLERVIKESLRLYPSVPMIGRKLVQDVEIDGYTIPAGVNVMLLPYFTHRDPEHFPNPEKFDPDNFLPERVAKRHPYAYVPFSAGPRNCIGQKFALLEEKTVLSYILRHYKVCSVNEEIIAIPELILRAENGVHLAITRREKCKS